jgi:hypothetical protein
VSSCPVCAAAPRLTELEVRGRDCRSELEVRGRDCRSGHGMEQIKHFVVVTLEWLAGSEELTRR